jgi:hypothetical protein
MLDSPIVQDIARFFGDYNTVGLKLPSQSTPETATLFAGELKMGVNGVFVIAAPSEQPDIDTGIIYQTLIFGQETRTPQKLMTICRKFTISLIAGIITAPTTITSTCQHNLGQIEDMDKDVEGAKLLKLSVRFIMMNSQALS